MLQENLYMILNRIMSETNFNKKSCKRTSLKDSKGNQQIIKTIDDE